MILQNGLFPCLHPAEMAGALIAGLLLGLLVWWLDAWWHERTARRRTSRLYRNLARTNMELCDALVEVRCQGQIEHQLELWMRDQLAEQKILIERLRPLLVDAKETH